MCCPGRKLELTPSRPVGAYPDGTHDPQKETLGMSGTTHPPNQHRTFLAALFCLMAAATPAAAGLNAGAQAWLSWSATGIQSDLAAPGASNNLYVRVANASSFKGGELDLTWNPIGDGESCAAHTGSQFKTSTGCARI